MHRDPIQPAPQSVTHRQHVVPVQYLCNFSQGMNPQRNTAQCFVIRKQPTTEGFRLEVQREQPVLASSICFIEHFYEVQGLPPNHIEHEVHPSFESTETQRALRHFRLTTPEHLRLNPDLKRRLAQFIAYQHCRGLAVRDLTSARDLLCASHRRVTPSQAEALVKAKAVGSDVRELQRWIRYAAMRLLITEPGANLPFYTSDNPVITINFEDGVVKGAGLCMPAILEPGWGTCLLVPLAPCVALFANLDVPASAQASGTGKPAVVEPALVEAFNHILIHQATRTVVADRPFPSRLVTQAWSGLSTAARRQALVDVFKTVQA